jgi:hypothetical protein
VILAGLFFVGDDINHPLSHQVKMDKIAKKMIPNANSAKKSQMHSVIFARKNTNRVYILTR